MRKIRVGIIGQGRSGRGIHGCWLMQDKQKYEIIAVSDPIKHRRDQATQEYGCAVYSKYQSLLERNDLDLIVNTLPSNLHMSTTLEILRAGLNCVCEKPMADNLKDMDRLIMAVKKTKKTVAVFQQYRYAPSFLQLRKIIDSGVLGRIVQINVASNGFNRRYDWQSLQKFMGGSLLNTGTHSLDQMLQLFGTDIVPEVFCHMDRATTVGDSEDHVLISLRGQGRPLINLEFSSCYPFPTPLYKVYGTQGGLEATMIQMTWRYFNSAENPMPRLTTKPLFNPDKTPAYPLNTITKWRKGNWSVRTQPSVWFNNMSKQFYAMLYKNLTVGTPLEITLEQIRHQVAIIEKCQQQNPLIYR